VKDMQAYLLKLRVDAAECALLRYLANDWEKRRLFTKLTKELTAPANEVERTMERSKRASGAADIPPS
jgi:hypothetical protein